MFDNYVKAGIIAEMYSAAVAASFASIYYTLALLTGNGALYLYMSRSNKTDRAVDIEAEMLVDSMLLNYSDEKGAIGILSESLDDRWGISDALRAALKSYRMSGGIDRFRNTGSGSSSLNSVVRLVSKHTAHRSGMRAELVELKDRMSKRREYEMRNYGIVHNGLIVMGLGTMVFFPIFSGIGLNVLRFSGFGLEGVAANAVLLGVSAYLLLSNYLNFRYSGRPISSKLMAGGMSGMVALSVFRITLLMSSIMLR